MTASSIRVSAIPRSRRSRIAWRRWKARKLFGSCHYILTDLLPRYGIESELVDGTDPDAWKKALSKPAKAVLFETPSNPTLDIVDIKAVTELAHAAGAR